MWVSVVMALWDECGRVVGKSMAVLVRYIFIFECVYVLLVWGGCGRGKLKYRCQGERGA